MVVGSLATCMEVVMAFSGEGEVVVVGTWLSFGRDGELSDQHATVSACREASVSSTHISRSHDLDCSNAVRTMERGSLRPFAAVVSWGHCRGWMSLSLWVEVDVRRRG